MNQRMLVTISIVVVVLLGAGIFWYTRQQGYRQDSSGELPAPTTSPRLTEEEGEKETVFDVVAYTTTSSATEIVTAALDGKRRIVFTDGDENLKLRLIRRTTSDGESALGLFAKKGEQTPKVLGWVATEGTGKITTLLENFGAQEAPVPSADSKRVAYITFSNADPDYGYQLLMMNTDGSNKRRLARRETLLTQPTFSPYGKKLAYLIDSGNGMAIQVVPTDGSQEGSTIAEFPSEIVYDLFWADELYFGKRPKEETKANEGELYRIKPEGGGLSRITTNDAYDGTPVLSPDGRYLALVRSVFPSGKYSSAGELTLVVTKLSDKSETELGQADGILGWKSAQNAPAGE